MRPRAQLAAMAALGLILFSPACGVLKTTVDLTNADNGRSLAVLVGDEIDVTLQTIGPGSYGTPVLSSRAVRFVGESSPGPQNPGGPRQLFRFEAVATGRAEITIPHVDGFPEARDPFGVTVEVR